MMSNMAMASSSPASGVSFYENIMRPLQAINCPVDYSTPADGNGVVVEKQQTTKKKISYAIDDLLKKEP